MKTRANAAAGPTSSEADWALAPREVGARLAAGPFQALGKGRWSVPAVAYMSLEPLGERVLYVLDAAWAVEKAPARATVSEDDSDTAAFVSQGPLGRRKGRAA